MNTGVHDVASLGWRLSGVLKGWYGAPVLQNYSDERRGAAEQLIEMDKVSSMLIGREKPERFKDRPEDPMVLLGQWLEEMAGFANGLDIYYPENLLNDVQQL